MKQAVRIAGLYFATLCETLKVSFRANALINHRILPYQNSDKAEKPLGSWLRIGSAMLLLAGLINACSQGGNLAKSVDSPSATTVATSQASSSGVATSIALPTVFPTSTFAPTVKPTSLATLTARGDNALVEIGRTEFNEHCLECHDDNGTGTPGILIRYERLSEQRIKTVVREGLQIACCSYMSPVPESQISDDQIHALVVFLRSVQPDTFVASGD